MVKKNKTEKKPDFSFKKDKIREEIDKRFEKLQVEEEKTKIKHISDQIEQGLEIKQNLPDAGAFDVKFDEVKAKVKDKEGNEIEKRMIKVSHTDEKGEVTEELTSGIYQTDLREDALFWFIRSPEVVPSLIRQAIRTHLDIKKCHEPEKRKHEIPIILIVILIAGAAIITWMMISLMTKG